MQHMLHCSLSWTSSLRILTKTPALPQQIYKPASRCLSARAELLVMYRCCGSAGPSVRLCICSVKTKIFYNSPRFPHYYHCIFDLERSKVEVKNVEMSKSFFLALHDCRWSIYFKRKQKNVSRQFLCCPITVLKVRSSRHWTLELERLSMIRRCPRRSFSHLKRNSM